MLTESAYKLMQATYNKEKPWERLKALQVERCVTPTMKPTLRIYRDADEWSAAHQLPFTNGPFRRQGWNGSSASIGRARGWPSRITSIMRSQGRCARKNLDAVDASSSMSPKPRCSWYASSVVLKVAPRRRRELETAQCAMRRRRAEPALVHQSRESLGFHTVAGAVVVCASGALRDQDDEPCQE